MQFKHLLYVLLYLKYSSKNWKSEGEGDPQLEGSRKAHLDTCPIRAPRSLYGPSRCSDSQSQRPPSPPRVGIHQVTKGVKSLSLRLCDSSQPQRHLELDSCSLVGAPRRLPVQ